MKPTIVIFAAVILLSGFVFPASGLDSLSSALSQLCSALTGLLPVASMLMVLVGASVYAAGQLMGAETRARANVWATAALMGALVGLLINSIAPPVLSTIYGSTVSCSPSGSSPSPPPPPAPTSRCGPITFNPSTHLCCARGIQGGGTSYWVCTRPCSCS